MVARASPIPLPVCVATVAERVEVSAPPSVQSLGDTRKVCKFYKYNNFDSHVVLKYEYIIFY